MSYLTDVEFGAAMRSLRLKYAAICAEWAALKFEIALGRAAREAKYNPNWSSQPRMPLGYGRESGRWIYAGGAAARATSPPPARLPLPPPPKPQADRKKLGDLAIRILVRSTISLPLLLSGDTPQPVETPYRVPGANDLLLVHINRRATGGQAAYFARIAEPPRQRPFSVLGFETTLTYPAKIERLNVPVEVVGRTVKFDPAALSRAYGREIPGVTADGKPAIPKPLSAVPGSGVETQNEAEATLAASMRAQGRSHIEIEAAITDIRTSKNRPEGDPRKWQGVAYARTKIPRIDGRWLKGSHGNAGRIPGQIAEKLAGRQFKSFSAFRKAFWMEVGQDQNLSAQFTKGNIDRMRKGRAPFADKTQRYKSMRRYILHHDTTISREGGVYDMTNLVVVTPLLHQQITDPGYHFGAPKKRLSNKKGLPMTREEIVAVIVRLYSLQDSEEQEDALLDRLEAALPNADIVDLMYWTMPNLTPEQIADEALRRELEHARGEGSAANET